MQAAQNPRLPHVLNSASYYVCLLWSWLLLRDRVHTSHLQAAGDLCALHGLYDDSSKTAAAVAGEFKKQKLHKALCKATLHKNGSKGRTTEGWMWQSDLILMTISRLEKVFQVCARIMIRWQPDRV
eukprot:GHUV01054293.1.p1 GENE.GHUV01054293.1~~GHUV01054293.1.p1  ORF type:complete len:126 (+),score=18.43 GHUV01054293.1:166-543(+)